MTALRTCGICLFVLALMPAWVSAGESYRFGELAPGVYVHTGVHEEPNAHNDGDIANKGVVIGQKCVAVIDTGGSRVTASALIGRFSMALMTNA